MEPVIQFRILLDLIIAIALGGAIGFEREKSNKPVGFRTNMVIAGASVMIIVLSRYIVELMEADVSGDSLGADPTRIIYAVVFGVSFIGAGTIMKSRNEDTVHNLTTAATVLMSSVVGMGVALRLYILSVGVTILTLLINSLIRKISS